MLVSVPIPSAPHIPNKRRSTICLAYKRRFVREAGQIKNIKATARKYGVHPSQIRKWKAAFEKAMVHAMEVALLPGNEATTITSMYRRVKSHNYCRFQNGGRPTLFTSDFLKKFKSIVEERRRNNLSVTMHTVRLEAKKINPTLFDQVAERAFNHRMYRMMKKCMAYTVTCTVTS
jgi:Transposase